MNKRSLWQTMDKTMRNVSIQEGASHFQSATHLHFRIGNLVTPSVTIGRRLNSIIGAR